MPAVHLLWNFPPAEWTLPREEAHVWSASLLVPDVSAAELAKILSSDEKERAARFHFVKDKNRFVVARGFLRKILGSYLKIEPREIIFDYGAHGKPVLRGKKSLQFNLSHSGDLMLCAISRERDLGIDLEKISPLS
ncbi:MAG: 4'-phosphopantetheinyl transferase, partial [Verrucomicrobiota bacterium]|nr:4'-phosphopantetheinyl transferase [Verrucomicrobiota bacterium]